MFAVQTSVRSPQPRRAARPPAATRASALPATAISRHELRLLEAAGELRRPLTVARDHLVRLRRSAPSDALEIAVDELARLERVVARMLLVAELETGPARLRPVELSSLLRAAVEARPPVPLAGLAGVTVAADERLLLLALDELLANALARSRGSADVTVGARRLGGGVAIDVADGGPGLAAARAAQVLECFARAEEDRCRATGGAGLGLAIVRAVARAHRGRCLVHDRGPEAGAVWSLHLPTAVSV